MFIKLYFLFLIPSVFDAVSLRPLAALIGSWPVESNEPHLIGSLSHMM